MSEIKNKTSKNSNYLKNTLIIVSVLIFISSLFYPAFFIDREDSDAWSNSLFLFVFGWTSFIGGGFIPFLIWLANPLYLISLILVKKSNIIGLLTISISIFLAIVFCNLDSILTSESGATSKIIKLGLGFYLWLSSFFVLLLPAISNLINKRKKEIIK